MDSIKCAVTGSFDPMTEGHLDIIRRAQKQFGRVAVVMLKNPERDYMFTDTERAAIAMASLNRFGKSVIFDVYDGMTADYVKSHGIKIIVRGIKNPSEFGYEKEMSVYNKKHGGAETLLLTAESDVSGTAVRDAIKDGKSLEGIVALEAVPLIKTYIGERKWKN